MALICEDRGQGIIHLSGELNIYHAKEAHERLKTLLDREHAQIDLSGIMDMDFTGAQLLLAARHAAHSAGRAVCIRSLSAVAHEALELMGVVPELMCACREEGNHESR